MILKPNDKKIRYTGRWNIAEKQAFTTASGNYMEFAFSGECAVIGFDISNCIIPFPHVYVSVDDGPKIDVPIDRYIRISADSGEHKVKIIIKSFVEIQKRWHQPIEAKVGILDIEADEFIDLPPDTKKVIEFLGDSITEGISIDTECENYYGDGRNMIFCGDSTATYAWLTAKELDLRPVIMGYGCLGTTSMGAGGVPVASEAYPYACDGCPIDSSNPDFIVINHGTNDRKVDKETFKRAYYDFLKTVRSKNKNSKIISLTPFCGELYEEIHDAVSKYNEENNDDVFYINSAGWIPPEPIHPTREGHKIVSQKLLEILKAKYF